MTREEKIAKIRRLEKVRRVKELVSKKQNPPQTLQEQHPDISFKERAVLKNFANSPESAVAYLKQENPNLEVNYDQKSGQYKVRAPGENDYRVVDPDTGFFSGDFINDATDVGYDLYSMGSEGLATALGALGGAAVTAPAGGVGALPGGVAAGGASSAANEALRQRLGKSMGIPQNVDMTDVAIAGTVGAASPLLFGAGKARGAVKTAWDGAKSKVFPKIGQMVSGVPSEVLSNYAKPTTMETVDKLSKEGVDDFAGKAYDKVSGYIQGNIDDAGEKLVSAIDDIGAPIQLVEAKSAYKTPMKELSELGDDFTNSDAIKLNQLKGNFDRYYGRAKPDNFTGPVQPEIADAVSARKAWQIQKDLKQAAKWGTDMSPEDLYTKGAARNSSMAINDAFDEASQGLTTNAKTRYKDAMAAEAEILPKFEGRTRADSIQKTYDTLSGMDRNSKKILSERMGRLADEGKLDLNDEIDALTAYKYLGKTGLNPFSRGGTTSTTRSIPLSVAGGSLGALAGYNSGGGYSGATVGGSLGVLGGAALGSPAAMKAYIKAADKTGMWRALMTPKDDTVRRGVMSAIWSEMMKDAKDVGE